MKKILAALTIVLLHAGVFATGVRAQDVHLYLTEHELPNLVKCLPAPPDTIGEAFTHDIMRYMWGKTQRLDSVRLAQAKRDAIWNLDTTRVIYSEPFGYAIDPEQTPEIYRLFVNGVSTIEQIRFRPKAHYFRMRPYARFHESSIFPQDDAWLATEGSYPSGHTIRAWSAALILAEVNPNAAEALFHRAVESGESRVIAGAHWQSDVDASRLCAAIGVSRLHTSPNFLAQLEKARNEFQRLTGQLSPTDDFSQFVNITDVVPDAILVIRYYSTYNFVGTRVDGYLEPVALLTRQAADSLRAVSDDLKKQGYRLKIFDAYRPQCAVDHFMRWGADVNDTLMKPYFYPEVPRDKLFELGYIAEKSGHTRGSTVDLTLFDMATEKEVDMGGTFDWFGRKSHPDFGGNPKTGKYKANGQITAEQFHNRMILREAMMRHGFKPYDEEWWHFTLKNEPFPDTYFTFPVKQLSK